jgi:hypothetical protein
MGYEKNDLANAGALGHSYRGDQTLSLSNKQELLLSEGVHVCASTGVGFENFSACWRTKESGRELPGAFPIRRVRGSSFVF